MDDQQLIPSLYFSSFTLLFSLFYNILPDFLPFHRKSTQNLILGFSHVQTKITIQPHVQPSNIGKPTDDPLPIFVTSLPLYLTNSQNPFRKFTRSCKGEIVGVERRKEKRTMDENRGRPEKPLRRGAVHHGVNIVIVMTRYFQP